MAAHSDLQPADVCPRINYLHLPAVKNSVLQPQKVIWLVALITDLVDRLLNVSRVTSRGSCLHWISLAVGS